METNSRRTDKKHLIHLADDIRSAVDALDTEDENALRRIQASLDKLQRAIDPPYAVVEKQRFRVVQNVTIAMALDMGLLAELAANAGKNVTASDLSATSGYDQVLIARVMRIVTALGFADEVDYQTYSANDLTNTMIQPGVVGGFMLTNEVMYPLGRKMRDYLHQHKPCNISKMPPAYDYATGEAFWLTLRKDPILKKGFDDAMNFKHKQMTIPWFQKYPVIDKISESTYLANGATPSTADSRKTLVIVDIGANQGIDLQRFAESYPDIPCELILEDLPETINRISVPLDSRIKPTVYDFFTPQPIKGAEIYYLKSVLHDWDDEASIKILSNTAKVMLSHSRLLINDVVLSDTNEISSNADMDMLMLFMSNGMERTRTQWTELLASVEPRLRILDVWSKPGDTQSVIEACLAE